MGFKKFKPDINQVRQWKNFVETNTTLFSQAGMPSLIWSREDRWQDFLHHGRLEMDDDLTGYRYPHADIPEHQSLVLLIERYFELRGTCVSLWPGLLSLEEEQTFAEQFAPKL